MTRTRYIQLLSLAVIALLSISCGPDQPDKGERIRQAVEEKALGYEKKELVICIDRLKARAAAEVDSLLRIRSKQAKIDTISPPSRFNRPSRPDPSFKKYEKPEPLPLETTDSLKK